MSTAQPQILQTRGGLHGPDNLDVVVEARHPWSGVAVQAGHVVWSAGPDIETTWRSAAKPLQLACCLELLGDPGVVDEELAVGAASHSGQPEHLRWVRKVLARFDVTEADLRCGTHPPAHLPSAEEVLRQHKAYSAIHNNCSGKHAFMLAAASRQGWPLDYRPPDHPLQRHIYERVVQWTQTRPQLALDGCGVPTFCLPLSGIGRAWATIAEAMEDPLDRTRLGLIGRAMAQWPMLTSGTDRLDLDVVRLATEPMAVKVGAQGVFCIALPRRRLGIAVKVHSGDSDAVPAAVATALRAVAPDAWTEPSDWKFTRVFNVAGRLAGHYRSE